MNIVFPVPQDLGVTMGKLRKPCFASKKHSFYSSSTSFFIYCGNYIQFVAYEDTATSGELGLGYWAISCEITGPCQLGKHLTSERLVCYFIFKSWSRFSPAPWGQTLVGAIIYSLCLQPWWLACPRDYTARLFSVAWWTHTALLIKRRTSQRAGLNKCRRPFLCL